MVNSQELLFLAKARRRRAEAEAHTIQAQSGTTEDVGYPSDMEIMKGFGEVGLTMGTGMLAEIAAGVGGTIEAVASFVRGDDDVVNTAEDRINEIRQSYTYQPRTQEGKDALRMLGVPFQKFEQFADKKGEEILKATESPAAAAAIKTTIITAPDLLGMRGTKLRLNKRAKVKALEVEAKNINLELKESPTVQREQIVKQAQVETANQVTKGQSMESIQASVSNAKKIAKKNVTDLYTQARNTEAALPLSEAKKFHDIAVESLDGYDIADLPIVKKRLAEIAELSELQDEAYIKLEAIESFRKRLIKHRPDATDLTQQSALGIMRGQLDEFLDAQFNTDMIKGSPEALQKWKNARTASAAYKERFRDNKVIRQLAEQKATPEEVRSWIFGASKMGFKKETGQLINRLKTIVGEDSPQFAALRQDALLNILDPLLKDKPNFNQFARVYDDLVKNNPTLVNELFPDSATHLSSLRMFASAIEKNKATPISLKIEETISRALVGHQIAKAAIRVTLLGQILKLMRFYGSKTQKSRVLGTILGYDPSIPLLPLKPALIGGAVQTGIEQGQYEMTDVDREISDLIRR